MSELINADMKDGSGILLLNNIMAAFQNVSCFVFEQSIVLNNAQNIYNVLYFKTSSMCISNAVKMKSGIYSYS